MRTFGKALVQVGFAAREEKPVFVKMGMCFDELSNLWEVQTSKDWEPFHRVLYEYKVAIYPSSLLHNIDFKGPSYLQVLVSNWNHCLGKVLNINQEF